MNPNLFHLSIDGSGGGTAIPDASTRADPNPWAEGAMHSWHEARKIAIENCVAREVEPPAPEALERPSRPLFRAESPLVSTPEPRATVGDTIALWQEFATVTAGEFCLDSFIKYCDSQGFAGVHIGTAAVRALKKTLVVIRPQSGPRPALYRFPEVAS